MQDKWALQMSRGRGRMAASMAQYGGDAERGSLMREDRMRDERMAPGNRGGWKMRERGMGMGGMGDRQQSWEEERRRMMHVARRNTSMGPPQHMIDDEYRDSDDDWDDDDDAAWSSPLWCLESFWAYCCCCCASCFSSTSGPSYSRPSRKPQQSYTSRGIVLLCVMFGCFFGVFLLAAALYFMAAAAEILPCGKHCWPFGHGSHLFPSPASFSSEYPGSNTIGQIGRLGGMGGSMLGQEAMAAHRLGTQGGTGSLGGDAAGAQFFTPSHGLEGDPLSTQSAAGLAAAAAARAAAEAHQAELQQKQELKLRQQQKKSEQEKEERRKREQQQQEEEEERRKAEAEAAEKKRKKEEEEEASQQHKRKQPAFLTVAPGALEGSIAAQVSASVEAYKEAVKAQKAKCERLMPVAEGEHGVQMKMVSGPCLPPDILDPELLVAKPQPAKRPQGDAKPSGDAKAEQAAKSDKPGEPAAQQAKGQEHGQVPQQAPVQGVAQGQPQADQPGSVQGHPQQQTAAQLGQQQQQPQVQPGQQLQVEPGQQQQVPLPQPQAQGSVPQQVQGGVPQQGQGATQVQQQPLQPGAQGTQQLAQQQPQQQPLPQQQVPQQQVPQQQVPQQRTQQGVMGQPDLPLTQIPDHIFAAQGRMFEISLPSAQQQQVQQLLLHQQQPFKKPQPEPQTLPQDQQQQPGGLPVPGQEQAQAQGQGVGVGVGAVEESQWQHIPHPQSQSQSQVPGQEQGQGQGLLRGQGQGQGDLLADILDPSKQDDAFMSSSSGCIDYKEIQRMALNSGGPFLLLKGQRPGYTRQQEGILRALWVANVTGSTVVLPQFFMSYDNHPVEATSMEKYFNLRHFIAYTYCSTGIFVLPDLPKKLKSRLPGKSLNHLDKLLEQGEKGRAEKVPLEIVGAKTAKEGLQRESVRSWLQGAADRKLLGKLQYLVYETEQVVEFTTPEQKAVKRSGLAALRPSGDVSEATAQLIQRMRRMHDEKFGELGQFRFVVAHISMDANGGGIGSGSGAAGAVTRLFGALKASVSRGVLLYVTMEPIPEHEEVMKLLTTTFQVVTRQDLWPEAEKLYPEHEFMAALEQGVARDAALYVGLSSSPFSQFVFQTRCFAPGPIVEAGAALVQPRPTVFYDRNTTAAPCQVL